jgi:hypothetical protein
LFVYQFYLITVSAYQIGKKLLVHCGIYRLMTEIEKRLQLLVV